MVDKVIQFSAFKNRRKPTQKRVDKGVTTLHPKSRNNLVEIFQPPQSEGGMFDGERLFDEGSGCGSNPLVDSLVEDSISKIQETIEILEKEKSQKIVGGINQKTYSDVREALKDCDLETLIALREKNPQFKNSKPSTWKALNDLIQEKS